MWSGRLGHCGHLRVHSAAVAENRHTLTACMRLVGGMCSGLTDCSRKSKCGLSTIHNRQRGYTKATLGMLKQQVVNKCGKESCVPLPSKAECIRLFEEKTKVKIVIQAVEADVEVAEEEKKEAVAE